MKLQEQLDAYKKSFAEKAPQEVLDTMQRAKEELKNSGILDHTVKVGDKAPDFALKNTRGELVHLQDLVGERPLVLSFYRGKW